MTITMTTFLMNVVNELSEKQDVNEFRLMRNKENSRYFI